MATLCMPPLSSQAVLDYVKTNGPSVPNDIRRAVGAQDNFITGAILSELVSKHQLATTDMQYGTSRFYYDPQHPEVLEQVSQFLNEKDVRACTLLKAEKVCRHSELSPLNRVAIAAIKDFSRAVRYQTPEGEELFWRYYLISEVEAIERIGERWFGKKPKADVIIEPQPKSNEPVITTEIKEEPKAERKTTKKRSSKTLSTKSLSSAATTTKVLEPIAATHTILAEGFAKEVHAFFDQKGIGLLKAVEIKKTELSLIVSVPTAFGAVSYFCKAKSKKSTTDGDLAAAYLESQRHELPLLFIAGGSLAKKAKELATTKLRGAIIVEPWA